MNYLALDDQAELEFQVAWLSDGGSVRDLPQIPSTCQMTPKGFRTVSRGVDVVNHVVYRSRTSRREAYHGMISHLNSLGISFNWTKWSEIQVRVESADSM